MRSGCGIRNGGCEVVARVTQNQPETDSQDLAREIALLDGWVHDDGALEKTYSFANFPAAMEFMAAAAPAIDALNHHPEWTNVYANVTVRLTTHDAGRQVTAKDVELARLLDRTRESLAN